MESRTFHRLPQVPLCHIVTSLVPLKSFLTFTPPHAHPHTEPCQGTPQQWLATGAQEGGGGVWMEQLDGSRRTCGHVTMDWCPPPQPFTMPWNECCHLLNRQSLSEDLMILSVHIQHRRHCPSSGRVEVVIQRGTRRRTLRILEPPWCFWTSWWKDWKGRNWLRYGASYIMDLPQPAGRRLSVLTPDGLSSWERGGINTGAVIVVVMEIDVVRCCRWVNSRSCGRGVNLVVTWRSGFEVSVRRGWKERDVASERNVTWLTGECYGHINLFINTCLNILIVKESLIGRVWCLTLNVTGFLSQLMCQQPCLHTHTYDGLFSFTYRRYLSLRLGYTGCRNVLFFISVAPETSCSSLACNRHAPCVNYRRVNYRHTAHAPSVAQAAARLVSHVPWRDVCSRHQYCVNNRKYSGVQKSWDHFPIQVTGQNGEKLSTHIYTYILSMFSFSI